MGLLMIKPRQMLESLSPRNQKILFGLTGLLLIIFSATTVQSLEKSRSPLQQNILKLRAQSLRLEQQSLQYHYLLGLKPVISSSISLDTLLQNHLSHSSLSPSLLRTNAVSAHQVIMTFGAVSFTDWLSFVQELTSQHIRVQQCRIEALSTPGRVNISATMVRATSL